VQFAYLYTIACAYHYHTASLVVFELSAGSITSAVVRVSVNGADITDEESIRTAALVHKVEDLTVQLYDASCINKIPAFQYKVEIQQRKSDKPATLKRMWRELNGESTYNWNEQNFAADRLDDTESHVFETFWLELTPPDVDILYDIEFPFTIPIRVMKTGAASRNKLLQTYELNFNVKANSARVAVMTGNADATDTSAVTIQLENELGHVINDNSSAGLICKIVSTAVSIQSDTGHVVHVQSKLTDSGMQYTINNISEVAEQLATGNSYRLVCRYTETCEHILQLLPQSVQQLMKHYDIPKLVQQSSSQQQRLHSPTPKTKPVGPPRAFRNTATSQGGSSSGNMSGNSNAGASRRLNLDDDDNSIQETAQNTQSTTDNTQHLDNLLT
jgi:hypothetical protein